MKLSYLFIASTFLFLGCKKDAVITPYSASISDGTIIEGNNGEAKVIEFEISLDAVVFGSTPVTVQVKTEGGTAVNNEDFIPLINWDQIPFNAGEKTKKIQIQIVEDNTKESNEEFTILLDDVSTNVKIVDGIGKGTILNDD